jgi:hypothetical protein
MYLMVMVKETNNLYMPMLMNNNNTIKRKIYVKTLLLHIFKFTRTSNTCVWFYSKSSILFYNEPDAANRIGFDEQKSLPFFSSGFSLETLARLFSSMFIHAGFFIFDGISLRCSIWEARRKIYRRT